MQDTTQTQVLMVVIQKAITGLQLQRDKLKKVDFQISQTWHPNNPKEWTQMHLDSQLQKFSLNSNKVIPLPKVVLVLKWAHLVQIH
jgi:hypothetical protein